MNEEEKINPEHLKVRGVLRKLGPAILLLGLAFMAVGLISFFSAMTSFGPPKYFWCMFVGMPLMFVGLVLTKVAYLGAVSRYMAAESAPVGKDTINYMVDGTKESIRDAAAAVRDGLAGETSQRTCPECQHEFDVGAQFCDQCGYRIVADKQCVQCGTSNDADAKFCDSCGIKVL